MIDAVTKYCYSGKKFLQKLKLENRDRWKKASKTHRDLYLDSSTLLALQKQFQYLYPCKTTVSSYIVSSYVPYPLNPNRDLCVFSMLAC